MNKPAHLMGGLTVGIAVTKYTTIQYNGVVDGALGIGAVLCGALLGSLLPDIDHRNSYIGKKLKIASFIISKTLGHRSVVHAPLVIFTFSALLYFLTMQLTGTAHEVSRYFVIGLSYGMFSHLFLDMLTKRGIPLFYPISKKGFRLAKFSGGGIGDRITINACIAFIAFMLFDFIASFFRA